MKSKTPFPLIYKSALILAALIMTLSTLGLAAVRPALAQGPYEDCTLLYAVQEDETLDDISERFDVDEVDLLDLNPFLGSNPVFPGLILCITTQSGVVIPPTGAQPGVRVIDVDPGDRVTVQGVDFPGNTFLTAQMLDFDETDPLVFDVATVTTPQGGDFQATFAIPEELEDAARIRIRLVSGAAGVSASDVFVNTGQARPPAACTQFYTVRRGDTLSEIAQRFNTTVAELVELNNIPNRSVIFSGQRLCVSTSDVVVPPTGGNPILEVLDVSDDNDVTLRVRNLPAGAQCEVLLGAPGSQFASAGTFSAPQDGSFTRTFALPQGLRDELNLAARVACPGQGITLNAQFTNPNVVGGEPALDVINVDEDNSVTLRVRNIPTGTQCEVQLGAPGAQFARAGTFTAPQDGSYVRTFALPQGLRDERNLAARVVCPNEDITLTTEFTNVNVGGGQAPGGNPVLDVLGVDQNDDVTLRVRNLPAGADCEVQLGAPGAQFARVGTFTAPQDGTFIRTFDLPQGLLDERNLAARVVCPDENISLTTEFQN